MPPQPALRPALQFGARLQSFNQEDADMKMRKRKREICKRLYIGLQVAALIAELEHMADQLRDALKESDPQYAPAEVEV